MFNNYDSNFILYHYNFKINYFLSSPWGLGIGIGDWGLGIGDWGLGPIPNPQSPAQKIIYFKIIMI
jgi:hypothetical protein